MGYDKGFETGSCMFQQMQKLKQREVRFDVLCKTRHTNQAGLVCVIIIMSYL
jgi:hypothetical protein